jgi:CheY-like chemotaxis protein
MSAILGIVRGHRGALFVESAVGAGTTIRILFPALAMQQVQQDAAAAAPAGEAGAVSGTVLVVDDEEMVRNVCRAMVESFGMRVLTAVDGREAVNLFTKQAAEISHVILDLTMPNMDGMAAFRELVQIKPDVNVVFSSGYDERESIQRIPGAEPARFIQKPYTLDKLRDALKQSGKKKNDAA